MRKITYYLIAFFFAAFSWQGMAQVLNQSAGWPNTNWTITGNYNADPTAFESDPTTTSNFAFDDDDAGSASDDNIAAESPTIDLTGAYTAGETYLSISGDYVYNYLANDELKFQYWDADSSTWMDWGFGFTEDTASAPTDDYCSGTYETYTSSSLDISSFTTTQLAGFKYRISYDDDPAGDDFNYGFCFQSPTIISDTCPSIVTNILVNNFTSAGNADLSWDVVTGVTYNWEIQPQGEAQGNSTTLVGSGSATTNITTVSSLTEATTYTLYVQTDCGSSSGNWMSYDFTFIAAPDNDLIGGAIPIIPKADGTTCDDTTEFTARIAGDGATDSGLNGSCFGDSTGIDLFYSWTATTPALLFTYNAGGPGVVVRDSDGNEIDCKGTYADDVLKGWAVGDDLIIQVYDYEGSDDDITFCLSVINDDDGDGVDNTTEANDGTDPNDPCDPVQVAGYTGYDATNTIWGDADCDGDGQDNAQEAAGGSDPYDASSTVSVEELEAIGFKYYPNPVNSSLTVKANENITSVAIFNMLGQLVKQVNPSSLNAIIDMTSLTNGTYFIKATVGEKVGTFKIIKK